MLSVVGGYRLQWGCYCSSVSSHAILNSFACLKLVFFLCNFICSCNLMMTSLNLTILSSTLIDIKQILSSRYSQKHIFVVRKLQSPTLYV